MQADGWMLCSGIVHTSLAPWRRRCKLVCGHNVHVALCRIPDVAELRECCCETQLRPVLQRHHTICQHIADHYNGLSICCSATPCPVDCDSYDQLFCFHSLDDALLWALVVQQALLQEVWPSWLQSSLCARTLWHSSKTSSAWQVLCAGPRTSIVINEQRFTHATALPVRLQPALCVHVQPAAGC